MDASAAGDEGAEDDQANAAMPAAEPARTLPKRGSKKAKKAAPEQERTDQVTAGRKAAKKKAAKAK